MKQYDYIVIGSGFGGAVASLRLVEKGYRVLVIEAGRRFEPKDFPKTNWNLRKSVYFPYLGFQGILKPDFFKSIMIFSGAGYGGGSLGYANTLIRPSNEKWQSANWVVDGDWSWQQELSPYYDVAERMLGVNAAPDHFYGDQLLKQTAETLGYGQTYSPVPVAAYFGKPGVEVDDPYFGGEGPKRTGCTHCGGCMVGCRVGAKNTLDKNYLYLAEKRGLEVITSAKVANIVKLADGYELEVHSSRWPFLRQESLHSKNVVVAAGVLGTLRLLFNCKDISRTLASISDKLGFDVCTNNESFHGVRAVGDDSLDCSKGVAISSSVNPDKDSKIEIIRFPRGSSLLGLLAVPYARGNHFAQRFINIGKIFLKDPIVFLKRQSFRRWSEESLVFMVMQSLETKCRIKFTRRLMNFFRRDVNVVFESENLPPVVIEHGRRFAEALSNTKGYPQAMTVSELFDQRLTAHILGGCPMGEDAAKGVINFSHEVHNYPGLYVLGGAAVPGNLGVNPSLTIAAMAERAMAQIPVKEKRQN